MTRSIEIDAVLEFWFGDAEEGAASARWFAVDPEFDVAIRLRFGELVERAAAGLCEGWTARPRSWLALLIVLDQFPRNLYRGDPRAFAADSHAQAIAQEGLARGFDAALSPLQRVFAYLPLEHAENLLLQERAVLLFEALARTAPDELRGVMADYAEYARGHAHVIRRFGRFPHRNAVLGRISTAEEGKYLAQPGAGF